MKITTVSGAALAAAAFTLAIGATALVQPAAAAGEKVMCFGVNACKGQAACKTASNACKGQAACKGQGWIYSSADQCKAWGGKVEG